MLYEGVWSEKECNAAYGSALAKACEPYGLHPDSMFHAPDPFHRAWALLGFLERKPTAELVVETEANYLRWKDDPVVVADQAREARNNESDRVRRRLDYALQFEGGPQAALAYLYSHGSSAFARSQAAPLHGDVFRTLRNSVQMLYQTFHVWGALPERLDDNISHGIEIACLHALGQMHASENLILLLDIDNFREGYLEALDAARQGLRLSNEAVNAYVQVTPDWINAATMHEFRESKGYHGKCLSEEDYLARDLMVAAANFEQTREQDERGIVCSAEVPDELVRQLQGESFNRSKDGPEEFRAAHAYVAEMAVGYTMWVLRKAGVIGLLQ